MAVANTNRIMTHGDGEAIAKSLQNVAEAVGTQNENVRLTGDQTIAGSKSFSSPVKTNEIDSLDGVNAMVRNADSAIVLGSSTKKAVLMGNGDRPTYSKDGSDLTGQELALKSDIQDLQSDKWNELYSAYNQHLFQGKKFYGYSSYEIEFDEISNRSWNYNYMFAGISLYNKNNPNAQLNAPVTFSSNNTYNTFFIGGSTTYHLDYMFFGANIASSITLPALADYNVQLTRAFFGSAFTRILIENDGVIKAMVCDNTFSKCANLTEIGKFDMSNAYYESSMFYNCGMLKSIHCIHWKASFNISSSTKFEEADLVEILNNLDPVSTTQTLTMGATNLAKLTDDDILIATGKGWKLV